MHQPNYRSIGAGTPKWLTARQIDFYIITLPWPCLDPCMCISFQSGGRFTERCWTSSASRGPRWAPTSASPRTASRPPSARGSSSPSSVSGNFRSRSHHRSQSRSWLECWKWYLATASLFNCILYPKVKFVSFITSPLSFEALALCTYVNTRKACLLNSSQSVKCHACIDRLCLQYVLAAPHKSNFLISLAFNDTTSG